jgi:ATP synthase F1 delta subunit
LKKHKHSKKFAKMFLNVVGLENAPQALKELKVTEALMSGSPEFQSLLVSPVFTEEDRTSALRQVGEKAGFSEHTVKFLGFLSGRGAAGALSDVIEKAVAIYSEKMARVKATVITPIEIDKDYEARLLESIKKIAEKEIDIEYEVDPSLLGGMLVKVGSTMYDGTLKGQLRLLRDELIRG